LRSQGAEPRRAAWLYTNANSWSEANMIHILFAMTSAFGWTSGRFPQISGCADLLSREVSGMAAIERLESLGGERGDARLIWVQSQIGGDDLEAFKDSARTTNVQFKIEGFLGWLGKTVGVFQASGAGREVSLFLKDVMFNSRELSLVEWRAEAPDDKDDTLSEEDFRRGLRGKAFAEFLYSLEGDEHLESRALAIMRIWPSTLFSSRLIYMRLEKELKVTRLAATTFEKAFHEWKGAAAWAEIDGEAFLFGDHELLWDLRDLRRDDLRKWEIDLKADPRAYLD